MLIRNIVALNLIYAAKLVLPLILLPVLAHRLSPEGYGVYMYSLSLSAWLSLFVEYGFNLYSTREIAGKQPDEQRAIVIGTQSARTILAFLTLTPAVCLAFSLEIYKNQPWWGITAWAIAVLTGTSPVYFYQAKENLQRVAFVEIVAGIVMLVFASIIIHDDSRLWILALIFFLTRLGSTGYLTSQVWKETGLRWHSFLDIPSGVKYLRLGFHFFIFQAAVSLYTSFNVVLLGLFRPPAEVGAYASAERLIKAGLGFIGQASQALFARLNNLNATHAAAMKRLRIRALGCMFAVGIIGSFVALTLADFIAQLLFPASAAEVAHMLKIFAALVPAIALSSVLGLHYLIVDRQEVLFNRIIITASLANLVIATVAIQLFGAEGLALSWVLIEWAITILIACSIVWGKKRATNLKKPEHV